MQSEPINEDSWATGFWMPPSEGWTLEEKAVFKPACFQIVWIIFIFLQASSFGNLKLFLRKQGYFKKVITTSVSAQGSLVVFLVGEVM